MTSADFIIREIKPTDNIEISKVIKSVILEMGAPKTGTAYEDKATDMMFETYQKEKVAYFVVVHENKVIGGAGIAKLDNCKANICELQKMYFSKSIRGKGLGKEMLQKCLNFAIESNFKICYLETITQLQSAIILYDKFGFKKINGALGNTSHFSCDIHMTKNL